MNDNFNEKDVIPNLEGESISLEELESRLLGLMNELEEIKERDSEAPVLEVAEEISLRTEAVSAPLSSEGEAAVDAFKDLDSEKAIADEDFAFKLDGVADVETSLEDDRDVGVSNTEYVNDDDLFFAAARLVVEERVTSISFLQRQFGIGFGRAAGIIRRLEELAIVSPMDGNNPRRVLVSPEKLEKILAAL